MSGRRHLLVCYDVRDARRLRRVHRVVRDFGEPLQYSVFVCRLDATTQAELERRVLEVIDTRVDSVVLVDCGPVGAATRARLPGLRMLGAPTLPDLPGAVIC